MKDWKAKLLISLALAFIGHIAWSIHRTAQLEVRLSRLQVANRQLAWHLSDFGKNVIRGEQVDDRTKLTGTQLAAMALRTMEQDSSIHLLSSGPVIHFRNPNNRFNVIEHVR